MPSRPLGITSLPRAPAQSGARPWAWMLALWLALSLAAGPALAQWKWRDKSGRITVSDLPPPREVLEADILQRPDPAQQPRAAAASASAGASAAAGSGPQATATPPIDKELQARKRAADADKAAQEKAEADKLAAQRQDNCRNARNHVLALESGQRMARVNDKGEREILDDRQRAAEMQRARAVVSSDCR